MALPDYSMRRLLKASAHLGHKKLNPKMGSYISGTRNEIHIIDLAKTVPMLHRALQAVSDTVAAGGRILFVGTKRQAQDAIADAATRSAQYYVNSRWLGGTLTNWKTISNSISRLRKLEEMLNSAEAQVYTKKERLTLTREKDKLDRALGGIKDMGGLPDLMFVIDTNKEDIAIKEARRLNIPVAAVVDTNCDPDGITYTVPGNDDAARAIVLYCDLVAKAAIDGISRAQGEMGIDIGAAEKPIVEEVPAETAPSGFQPLSGPRGVADDLKKLAGVSPTIEKRLNDLGIFHFWQIAGLSPIGLESIRESIGLPDWMPSLPEAALLPPRPSQESPSKFKASQKLVDLLHQGLQTHAAVVKSKFGEFSNTAAIERNRAEAILVPRILEIIASRARRMQMGVAAVNPLLKDGEFDYEFVLEISENLPFRIDQATQFFDALSRELVSFLRGGGEVAGRWGKLILNENTIEFELRQSNAEIEQASDRIGLR